MAYKDPEKAKQYYKIYNFKRKDKIKEYSKQYYIDNREEIRAKYREWYLNNKEEKLKKNKEWNSANRDKIRIHKKQKRDKYPSERLIINLRRRTLLALKGKNKSANAMILLGVNNVEKVWIHLEKSFKPGMTRKNHGKWHIDHIKPCASFDLTKPEEQAKCFHYTNLQPLWASENLAKGSKIS